MTSKIIQLGDVPNATTRNPPEKFHVRLPQPAAAAAALRRDFRFV
jgi:hypothetical protein